jgi:crotonobetainyl-CoA:carnitine CoA-transferase CaiB-like acyl-CoA transferase
VPHPSIPDLQLVDLAMSRDGRRGEHELAHHQIGEHTLEILRELAYGNERIDLLRQMGVVG